MRNRRSAHGRGKQASRSSREEYVDGILRGDRTVLARAVTLIESAREADRELAEQIVEDCLPHSGHSIRVGITGVPGAGKSTLIEALGRYLITEQKQKVAVLAVDPSSQLSGGSILGDKTRMTTLAGERDGVRPAVAIERNRRRRGATDARSNAAVRGGRISATFWWRRSVWVSQKPRCTRWWTFFC